MKNKKLPYVVCFFSICTIGALVLILQWREIVMLRCVNDNLQLNNTELVADTTVMHMVIDSLAFERDSLIGVNEHYKSWKGCTPDKMDRFIYVDKTLRLDE